MGNHVEMVWETPLTDLGSPDSVKYSDKIYLFLGGTWAITSGPNL